MNLLKNIRVNFKMIFTNYGFYICAVFTAVLCLCGSIYHDSIQNESYSAIRVLMEFDEDSILNNTAFCSYQVIQGASGSWLSMFLPIISAFAFIPIICDERESKMIRNMIFRSSKTSFFASKFIMTCLSGGMAVALGFIFFTGIICMAFPSIRQYSPELQEQLTRSLEYLYPFFLGHSYVFLGGLKVLEMFLCGVFAAVPAIFLTSLMRNKYLVLCIPFFINYAVAQTCEKLISKSWSNLENPNVRLGRFAIILSPDSISNLFQSGDKLYILLYHLALLVIAFLCYIKISNRRLDCGE